MKLTIDLDDLDICDIAVSEVINEEIKRVLKAETAKLTREALTGHRKRLKTVIQSVLNERIKQEEQEVRQLYG